MKKLLLVTVLVMTCMSTAQGVYKKEREVDISVKFEKWIKTIQKNELFSFIENPPKKITEVYNCDGAIEFYTVKNAGYSIEFRSNNIVVSHEGNKFYLTMVNDDFVGYGCTLDTREKLMITYYFQNDKIVKKSVKKYSN